MVKLPYQAVIQPDRMLSMVHLYKFVKVLGANEEVMGPMKR
jgi:hypothetical protein